MNPTEELFSKDRYAALSHIRLIRAENGSAEAEMTVCPEHLNGVGIVQGGAIYTIADFALAAAANSRGVPAVTLTTTITFFKGESSGVFRAVAQELSLRHAVATYQVDVLNGQGERIAALQGTVYRKG